MSHRLPLSWFFLLSLPEPEVLQVAIVIPLHLVDAVAPELFDHGGRYLERGNVFSHHPGGGHSADVGTLHARFEGFFANKIHRAEWLHERGDGLHSRSQHNVLAIAHAPLDAACHVRLAVESGLPAPHDLVVHQGARAVRHPEAGADLDALDRLDAHDYGSKPAVQLPVPVGMAAEPYGNAGDDQFENTTQGVPGGFHLIDLPHHPLFRIGIGTAQL